MKLAASLYQGTRKRQPAPRFSFLKRVFYLRPVFLWENGLFFDLGIPELRVEKKKKKKKNKKRATPGARAQAPPARPAPRPESHGPHAAGVAS
jgi:hypothetical protein